VYIGVPVHGHTRDGQEASHRLEGGGVHVDVQLLQIAMELRLELVDGCDDVLRGGGSILDGRTDRTAFRTDATTRKMQAHSIPYRHLKFELLGGVGVQLDVAVLEIVNVHLHRGGQVNLTLLRHLKYVHAAYRASPVKSQLMRDHDHSPPA